MPEIVSHTQKKERNRGRTGKLDKERQRQRGREGGGEAVWRGRAVDLVAERESEDGGRESEQTRFPSSKDGDASGYGHSLLTV